MLIIQFHTTKIIIIQFHTSSVWRKCLSYSFHTFSKNKRKHKLDNFCGFLRTLEQAGNQKQTDIIFFKCLSLIFHTLKIVRQAFSPRGIFFFEIICKPIFGNFKWISIFFKGWDQNGKTNPFKSKYRRSNQERQNRNFVYFFLSKMLWCKQPSLKLVTL